jgi:hypothetical protein
MPGAVAEKHDTSDAGASPPDEQLLCDARQPPQEPLDWQSVSVAYGLFGSTGEEAYGKVERSLLEKALEACRLDDTWQAAPEKRIAIQELNYKITGCGNFRTDLVPLSGGTSYVTQKAFFGCYPQIEASAQIACLTTCP